MYDFVAEGNVHEAGYDPFVSGDHAATNAAHDSKYQMPSGLTISASNGSGLTGLPTGLVAGPSQDADGNNRQTLAMLNSADRRSMLKSITLPCLVIHGADDRILLPELGREIGELIPGARYEEVTGMGHVISPKLSPYIVEMTVGFMGRNRSGSYSVS